MAKFSAVGSPLGRERRALGSCTIVRRTLAARRTVRRRRIHSRLESTGKHHAGAAGVLIKLSGVIGGVVGITAGYSLGLPTIGVGVFSLENVGLSAALELPFVDGPTRLRFQLSERHDPFLVTVSLFGGGGFFGITVDTEGAVGVEAALEFGGNFCLDLVVASGGVHVMAGIYFKMAGPVVELSGYLRAGRNISTRST